MSADRFPAERAESVCAQLGEYAEGLTATTPMGGGAIMIAGADGRLATRTFGLQTSNAASRFR